MNPKQQIVAILGVLLLAVSFVEYWKPEAKAVLGIG